MFRLKLFGGTTLEGPAGPLAGRAVQRRRLALLALLAGARGRGVAREKLVAWLWPDADPERARHTLSDSVYRINQAVGGEAVLAVADELRLNAARLPCDVVEFGEAMAAGAWERAVELHAGPFLDGFYLTGADEFERWADAERVRLAGEKARALEKLADAAELAGDVSAAVHWARLLAAHDPFSSRHALRCMAALERAGERAAALQHARVHTLLMREELGIEPDPEVVRLEERLRAQPAPVPVAVPQATSRPRATPGPPATPTSADFVPDPGEAPPARPPRRRVPWVATAGALLLVLLLVVTLFAPRGAADGEAATALAVLPFQDLSEAGDQEYFADGITDELIVRLSRLEGLAVVGRTSAFAHKGSREDVRDIAANLGVDAVLAGSVRRAGDRLRVVAQLTDGESGYQLWAETYERRAADVFAIQDEIARAIVQRLRGERGGTGDADVVETDDPEAYNLYLRGRYEWHRRTEQGLRDAARYFAAAAERAPEYAAAHAGLGDAYAVLGFYDFLPPAQAFPRAAAAARRALELRPAMAEAHATLGYVALYYEWDFARAEAEFRRAVELNPRYSTGRQWYANFLAAMGRFDEAEREMRAAMELDPLSLIANAALGWVQYYAGDPERAVDQLTRTLELNDGFQLAYLWRGLALEELGRAPESRADLERAVQLSGRGAATVAALARAHALAGERAAAAALLREAEAHAYAPKYEIAKAYAALGDSASALAWLERALQDRSHSMVFLAVDPQLAAMRGTPGLERLIDWVGLRGHVTEPGS